MSADVLDLSAARRARVASPGVGVSLELESVPGEVHFAMLFGDDGLEAWLSPEEADELAERLKRHAITARGPFLGQKSCHMTTREPR